ncbi:MAG: VRR-NUC domain-containing protein [Parasphingopyxis sp.]
MNSLLKRIFGTDTGSKTKKQPAKSHTLEIQEFGHGLISIDALDFIGRYSKSPNGRYRLIWSDRNPEGTRGGHRHEGHGSWTLLSQDQIIAEGRLERPNDGQVADNGNFIFNDWMFGDRLNGCFHAFSVAGTQLIAKELAANISSNGLSADGRYAICQTANAPGSNDSCRYILFDLEEAREMARWEPETGWASGYEFDSVNRRLFILCEGDERVGYNFDGTMVDREGWQERKIAEGDISIIRKVLEGFDGKPDSELKSAMIDGLNRTIEKGEGWQQARALRLLGEIHEASDKPNEALKAYDKALTIDPQVGVSRRAEKLRKSLIPKSKQGSAKKMGKFERQAHRLGNEHEIAKLESGGKKNWRFQASDAWSSVEEAALAHYENAGWAGAAAEGGLMLTLIKAASFTKLDSRNADTFTEALYAQNVAFDEDKFDTSQLIETLAHATHDQLERNWKIISATAGVSPAYYPAVRLNHVLELFDHLGPERLTQIAQLFAKAPYDLRAGWPDLTLWKGDDVRFVEVKAPGDSMHANQARLISTILLPLGFKVSLAEVRIT